MTRTNKLVNKLQYLESEPHPWHPSLGLCGSSILIEWEFEHLQISIQ